MTCLYCEEDLIYSPIAVGDLTVCGQCGEIMTVVSLAPLAYRKSTAHDRRELPLCEYGRAILLYSDATKAARKGLSSSSESTH